MEQLPLPTGRSPVNLLGLVIYRNPKRPCATTVNRRSVVGLENTTVTGVRWIGGGPLRASSRRRFAQRILVIRCGRWFQMTDAIIQICCDSSFSRRHHLVVSGFALFESGPECKVANQSLAIHTAAFREDNNVRAEVKGVILALAFLAANELGNLAAGSPKTLNRTLIQLPSLRDGSARFVHSSDMTIRLPSGKITCICLSRRCAIRGSIPNRSP